MVIFPYFLCFQFDDSDEKEPNYDDLEYFPLGAGAEEGSQSEAAFYHR